MVPAPPPPTLRFLHWREGLGMLASRKLIQSWLTGMTGGTVLHKETMGIQLFWLVFIRGLIPLPRHSLVSCGVVFSSACVFSTLLPNKAELFRRADVIIWALCFSRLQRRKRSGWWRCSAVIVVKTLALLAKYSCSIFSYHEKNIKSSGLC